MAFEVAHARFPHVVIHHQLQLVLKREVARRLVGTLDIALTLAITDFECRDLEL